MDRTAANLLQEALEVSEYASDASCGFFATCPGPGKRSVSMETCSVCRTTQLLRRALTRLGLREEGQ